MEDKIIQDPYCYTNTKILINKENIKELKALQNYERAVTSTRLLELYKEPIEGEFDLEHLKNIHRYLFQDIYPFAGEFRKTNIGKDNKIFARKEDIIPRLKTLLSKMNLELYKINNIDELPSLLSEILIEINDIHPFREGNGRSERELLREYILEFSKKEEFRGIDLEYSKIHKEILRYGLIIGDKSFLEKEFKRALGIDKEKTL